MALDFSRPPHGVVPPLVTPLDEHGDVDRASLERLVSFQLDAGVDGLFVGGSSGEIALLDTARYRAAVEVVVGTAAGAVPVLAGAIDTGTHRVVEHARRAVELGVDAVVVTTPFYVRPGAAEIVDHFRYVHAAVDVPVVAYDIPSAVHVSLTPDVVAELADEGLVVALKDSSGDLAGFREILRRTDLPALTGSELFADTAMQVGAAGIVPGLGNVDPHGYVRLHRAAREGDHRTAAAEQERLARLFRITTVADRSRVGFTAGALGAFKAALAVRGVITHPTTNPPLRPLNDDEMRAIASVLAETGLDPVRAS
ncbi:dihydrodipicolinate synthase family protein [Saccharomonospora glauca]|uniref:Dihydrodipicolinate synthase/N-acetylneuraminate lyase n=1 Tax=Saccharomonospora glauca K62 TaxID=928724 RepID=I1D016_9PSEU|nr:dihydrodipicolinate synthase family protein [Saccharomonospora glauca]EIE98290.1 dihydrodipicolinate synthase/N-acetylneuraminate lyase [Saccharomonospora glauca K62]